MRLARGAATLRVPHFAGAGVAGDGDMHLEDPEPVPIPPVNLSWYTLSEPGQEGVVLGVRSNPEPGNRVTFPEPQRPVPQPDAGGVDRMALADPLEL